MQSHRPRPPATPLPQESVQPLPPSSMGGGASHAGEDEDEFGRYEVSQLPSTPPSQGNVQPLPDFTRVPHCSKWEDRDTMRGLGINSPHHVSSTVSYEELASRALAEINALRRKSGAHMRFPEDQG